MPTTNLNPLVEDNPPYQQLQGAHSGQLLRLGKMLQHRKGFFLIIAEYNIPSYRDAVIDWVSKFSQKSKHVIDCKAIDFPDLEDQLRSISSSDSVTHLIGIEELNDDIKQSYFNGLNYHRELIANICSNTFFIWLPRFLISELAEQATDFWTWRGKIIDMSIYPEHKHHETKVEYYDNTDLDKKQKRLDDIQNYLRENTSLSFAEKARLVRELANLHMIFGQPREAEQHFQQAISIYQELEDQLQVADTIADHTELMVLKGESDLALRKLNEDVLPIMQIFDKKREIANTKGKIADIMMQRGQYDEALKIRQTDELPIYEQLGSIREIAITKGKIADIMMERGQYDEALRIRQTDELPIYTQLGSIRDIAVTKGKITQIYYGQKKLKFAIALLEKQVLPMLESLGDPRDLVIAKMDLANYKLQESERKNRKAIEQLLKWSYQKACELQIPQMHKILATMKKHKIKP